MSTPKITELPPVNGIRQVRWDRKTWVLAWQFATFFQPLIDKSIRDRMLKDWRDKHPGVMRKMPKDIGITGIAGGAYLIPERVLPEVLAYINDPASIEIAKDGLTAAAGYGAGKRDALDTVAHEVILKTSIFGNDLELTRLDMPQLKEVIAELEAEVLDLRAYKDRAEDRLRVIRNWAVDEVRKARNAAVTTAKPRMSVPAATARIEIWKPVPGFAKYELSNMGRFRVASNHDEVNIFKNNQVPAVRFHIGKNKITKNAARIVAEAFLPPAKNMVLHFNDGDRFNVDSENLCWIDYSDPRLSRVDLKPTQGIWTKEARATMKENEQRASL